MKPITKHQQHRHQKTSHLIGGQSKSWIKPHAPKIPGLSWVSWDWKVCSLTPMTSSTAPLASVPGLELSFGAFSPSRDCWYRQRRSLWIAASPQNSGSMREEWGRKVGAPHTPHLLLSVQGLTQPEGSRSGETAPVSWEHAPYLWWWRLLLSLPGWRISLPPKQQCCSCQSGFAIACWWFSPGKSQNRGKPFLLMFAYYFCVKFLIMFWNVKYYKNH